MSATEQAQLFDIYLYDVDNGELLRVIKDIPNTLAIPMAIDYHVMEDVAVKVVDKFDGEVTYTLG